MKSFISVVMIGLAALAAASAAENVSTKGKTMKITSSAFIEGELIPSKFTEDGQDVNPTLFIEGVPENARSLALIVDDPDAPVGTWNHWLVWNIDPRTREIQENRVPEKAVPGTNDFGRLTYGGPAPPSGVHRYFFRVYALDSMLELPRGAKRAALDQAMKGHVVAEGALMGKYARVR